MSATGLIRSFVEAIDAQDWPAVAALLHPDFRCLPVQGARSLSKAAWLRSAADPERLGSRTLLTVVGEPGRAVARARVVGLDDGVAREVVQLVTARHGLIAELTELWIDLDEESAPDALAA